MHHAMRIDVSARHSLRPRHVDQRRARGQALCAADTSQMLLAACHQQLHRQPEAMGGRGGAKEAVKGGGGDGQIACQEVREGQGVGLGAVDAVVRLRTPSPPHWAQVLCRALHDNIRWQGIGWDGMGWHRWVIPVD
eukprot:scaffold4233_cov180-Ochromonas_danica.AAC.23